jgi:two-component system cell cycle response regulator DivK
MTRTVIAVVDDLFFASKIRGTGEQMGVTVRFARTLDALIEGARRDPPGLIICDLHSQKIDTNELAKQLKADDELRAIPLLGFFSHVQTELQQQALQAGFDQVVPRSAFNTNLAKILKGDTPDGTVE